MRKLLLILFFSSSTVFAQQEAIKSVLCYPTDQLLAALANKYQEFPVFTSKLTDNGNLVSLLINPVTQTWTFIEFDKNNACVVNRSNGYVITNLERRASQ